MPLTVNRVGSMLTGFFCDPPVTDYASAKRADTKRAYVTLAPGDTIELFGA